MNILSRLFGRSQPESRKPERGSGAEYRLVMYEPEDGRGRGLVVERVEDGQRLAWRTLHYDNPDIEAFAVAGEQHRLDVLQDDAFAPGKPLRLVPEPDNPYDPNAVAVWDADQRLHVGYVPREKASDVAFRINSGEHLQCLTMWEVLDEAGKRVALRALILGESITATKP